MTLLIDDTHLSSVLRGEPFETDEPLFTTGLWYLRLCQAVLTANRPTTGRLAAPIVSLPASQQMAAIKALVELPDQIGLLSLREVGPTMAEFRGRHQLNLLGLEALAAARVLDASVILSADSPLLEASLDLERISWERT